MTDITNLVEYYSGLLINQYNSLPKAKATIELMANLMLASGVMFDVQNGYNLDTAVGDQLDVIGKYEGIDRYYSAFNPVDYFSLETYTESAPSTPPRYGFTTYANYATDPPAGCLIYSEIVAANGSLTDSAFRTLIYLKIIQNYSNYGDGDLDARLYALFGTTIRMEDNGNMSMAYFIASSVNVAFVEAVIYKKALPRPMGVGAIAVSNITGPMFGFTDYHGASSPYAYGFSTYSNYASLAGLDLTYDRIAVI